MLSRSRIKHYRLKNHKAELIQLFYEIVETGDLNKIWTTSELTKRINKSLSLNKRITIKQMGHVIRVQKKYNAYKWSSVYVHYIFRRSNVIINRR